MYGKLVNGELILAPTNHRGIINYNLYPERMVEDGYKEVINTEIPDDGLDKYNEEGELIEQATKSYTSHYEEQEDKIVKVWE